MLKKKSFCLVAFYIINHGIQLFLLCFPTVLFLFVLVCLFFLAIQGVLHNSEFHSEECENEDTS